MITISHGKLLSIAQPPKPRNTRSDHENFHKQDIKGCLKNGALEAKVPTEGFPSKAACERGRSTYNVRLKTYVDDFLSWTAELWDKN